MIVRLVTASIIAGALVWGVRPTPPFHELAFTPVPVEFDPGPQGVTCCCRTRNGGMCCNEQTVCGGIVFGCFGCVQ